MQKAATEGSIDSRQTDQPFEGKMFARTLLSARNAAKAIGKYLDLP